MTSLLVTANGTTELRTIVIDDDVSVHDIPRRSYDFNRGDRRFYSQDSAISHANAEAVRTGVRQVVRLDGPALLGGTPLYLVQAVGS